MIYKTLKKVSDYCQLLDKSKFPATRTTNGITFTNNGDGTITVNGTATGQAQYVFVAKPYIPCKDNHKYLVKGSPSGGGYGSYRITTTVSEDGKYITGFSDSGSGNISNALLGSYAINILIDIYKGTTVSNLVFKPQLFDLTEMYGVGNEPTTVDEFKADFPNDLYDYKPYCFVPSYKNCLIHPIPITSGNLIDFPYASAYDTRQGMTFSQVDTYKVHASGVNNSGYGIAFDFIKGKTLSAGTYTIKYYTEGTVTTDLYFRGRKGSYYGPSLFPDNTRQKTFTLTEDTTVYIAFGFVGKGDNRYTGETIDLTVWCRLERGNDVTDYISSYKKSLRCTTKNLFDISKVKETDKLKVKDNNICSYTYPVVKNDPNLLSIFKSLKPDTNYTMSATTLNYLGDATNYIVLIFSNANDDKIIFYNYSAGFNKVTFSLTQEQINNITYVYFYGRDESSGGPTIWSNIQLEEGSTATEYHPYGYL